MQWTIFPNITTVLLGLIGGFIFGFLLRKGTVSRFDTIVSQLILKDFTVVKIIMTAIVTTSLGAYLFDLIDLTIPQDLSSMPVMMTGLGGLIFGVGMAVAGYCPGTMVAAMAEKSKDAYFGFFGMVVGVWLFNLAYPLFRPWMKQQDSTFLTTLDEFFGVPKIVIILLLIIAVLVVELIAKKLKKA